MRPASLLLLIVFLLLAADAALLAAGQSRREALDRNLPLIHTVTAALGVSDLCVATEARYTRHPAVSDPLAPFMDHPAAMEHFPTGSFWTPPGRP
ncbi:MAG: hypothetical protein AB1413_03230 [Thermodesulfobacteriota bacterium]